MTSTQTTTRKASTMLREITWKLGTGEQASVSVELILEETAYADGYNVPVKCCKMDISAEAKGQIFCTPMNELPSPVVSPSGIEHTHKIGRLAIPADKVREIEAAIAEIEATPEWQQKLATRAAAAKADAEYEAHREKMRKIMGY